MEKEYQLVLDYEKALTDLHQLQINENHLFGVGDALSRLQLQFPTRSMI
jgi:hypothetical protein